MKKLSFWDKTSFAVVIFGAINWGLVGLLRFNAVDKLLGKHSFKTRVVFILVGIAGIYLANQLVKFGRKEEKLPEVEKNEE